MGTSSESKRCPKCGGPITAESPQGLCPKCLLLQAATPTEAGPGGTAKATPPAPEVLAAAFPQLEILELIGRGGMGFVYKARQPKIERLVALKVLPHSSASDPAFGERFTREGRLLARLNHPNIVTLYDFGQANGFFYLLMEFVDGVNLRQAMEVGRFTPTQALAVVPKVCEALQFAHNEGILHRDIKPENILLDAKGRVKIADFGIAKLIGEPQPADLHLTVSGTVLGTPHYMAPEQLEHAGEVDQRADIYSLGVVFYEMLTGELPLGRFQPPSAKAPMDARLDDVVLQALEKEPARRYQQAGEVKTAVETISSTPPPPPVSAPAATAASRPDRFWRVFAIAVVVLLALPVGLGVLAVLAGIAVPHWLTALNHRALQPPEMVLPQTNAAAELSFGPVIERTLWRASAGSNCLLNFKTAELGAPPAEDAGSAVAIQRWAQGQGFDAGEGVLMPTNNVLSGFDLGVVPAPAACWDQLTPKQAAARLEPQPTSSLVVLLYAVHQELETCIFRTREGRIGLLQLVGFESQPPGIRIRYKITAQPAEPSGGQAGAGGTTPWAPVLLPGEKPDLAGILAEAKQLTAMAHFEEALQRYQWHFQHAQEYGDNWQNAVRVTSELADWAELGRRYPKARQALVDIRDHDTREITEGRGYAELFNDVQAINHALGDEEATYALFKATRDRDPRLMEQCYYQLQGLLVSKGEYEWLYQHLGEPQQRFDSIRRMFEMDRNREAQNLLPPNLLPGMPTNALAPTLQRLMAANQSTAQMRKQHSEDVFVGQTCQLIEILCGAGHKAEAEDIRNQALGVLKVERLQSAVSDAEKRIQERSSRTDTH